MVEVILIPSVSNKYEDSVASEMSKIDNSNTQPYDKLSA
jgi:hypothetical protein